MTLLTAFDSDVLIYAGDSGNPLARRITQLFPATTDEIAGTGSLILLTEVLAKPMRADDESTETTDLVELLSRLDLYPLDDQTAQLALALAVSYGLRAADSVHLATAIAAGADRFLTNNRKDFPKTITEIDVIYPDDLPDPDAAQDGAEGSAPEPE